MVKRSSVGAAYLGLVLLSSCDGKIAQPKVVQLLHDEAGPAGDGGHVIPPPKCEGKCCPDPTAAPECYFKGKNPSEYSGAECLAQLDNTGADRWQLRQTMSISTAPPGNANSTFNDLLIPLSELNSAVCNTGDGKGGFMQLVDFDRAQDSGRGIARTGFAAYVRDQSAALAQGGLCFAKATYDAPGVPGRLPEIYDAPPTWPKGLPSPQLLPWQVKPVTAARYDEDFDLATQRDKILERLDPDHGDLGLLGYNGVFYLDEQRGYMHGYGPLGYVVVYLQPPDYIAIPIREAEIRSQINDPAHPNCSGVYGTNPDLPATCASTSGTPAWSCGGPCPKQDWLAPTRVDGYFLTVEAEQVYIKFINQTLCNQLPGPNGYPGWTFTGNTCRSGDQWNPMDPVNGIPPGDWCAATNSAAHDDCHDAWHSVSFSTFQAFPIQDGTCLAQ